MRQSLKINQRLRHLIDCPDTAIRMAPFVIADDPADPLLDEVATENGFPIA